MIKFLYLITSLLTLSVLAMAQSHLVVYTKDGNHLETLVSNVDSIAFSKTSVTPDLPVIPVGPNPVITAGVRDLVDEAYQELNWLHDFRGYWGLNTLSADEAVCPVRNPGSHWYDGGLWADLNTMQWDATLINLELAWKGCVAGADLCNSILKQISKYKSGLDAEDYEYFVSELNVLRSYYYYTMFDLYGRIPYTESCDNVQVPLMEVQEVWENLVKCLEVHTPNLSVANVPSKVDNYGRVTQGFGYALLARLYLNAESYDVKTVNQYNKCVEYCQKVINSCAYSIEPNFFNNFLVHNENSRENIFVIVENGDRGYNYRNLSLMLNKLCVNAITQHYEFQGTYGLLDEPWNGFAASEKFLELYDAKDCRGPCPDGMGMNIDFQNVNTKYGWFLGPVFDNEGKQAVDENGLDVIITRSFDDGLENATWNDGARCMKYETELNSTVNEYSENDFVLFRYADVLYMYAEACLRGATNGSLSEILANADFQQIRKRAGVEPYTTLYLDEILDERGREFAWENVRRRDLIRFGKYTGNSYMWDFKSADVPAYRKWFSIPQKMIDVHATDSQFWTQNEGYATAITEFMLHTSSLLMSENDEAQEICALYASDEVHWASSDVNGEIFTMSVNGNKVLITPIAPGNGTITAICAGKVATCNVTIKEAVFYLSATKVNLIETDAPYELHALNAKTDVVWGSTDVNESVFKMSVRGNKIVVTPVAPGEGTITAICAGRVASCIVVVNESVSLPLIEGTKGKYTIAFHIPETLACNPVINFFGYFQDNDVADTNAPVAEKLSITGFENWYKIVFESADPSNARGKICPQIEGKGTWNAQATTYTLLYGNAEIIADYGQAIQCSETALGDVVYIDVIQWACEPCDRPNEAGSATYELIIKTEFPADFNIADLTVAATVGWDTDAMTMQYDPSYTGQGLRFAGSVDECPAMEQYKYIISYKGSDWFYETGDNRTMPYGNHAVDEVTEWDSEPWNSFLLVMEPLE